MIDIYLKRFGLSKRGPKTDDMLTHTISKHSIEKKMKTADRQTLTYSLSPAGASARDGAADGHGGQEDQVHSLPEQFHDARPRGGDKK